MKKVILLLIPILFCLNALGLNPKKNFSQFIIKSWTTTDGLPQNAIHCITQTQDGYLWLGTEDGLVRFDGVKFTIYSNFNTHGVQNNFITSFCETSDGTLWIGTNSQWVIKYKDRKFESFSYSNDLDVAVNDLFQTNGIVYIGTTKGLFTIDSDDVISKTSYSPIDNISILCFSSFEDNSIVIGTAENGLYQLKDDKLNKIPIKDSCVQSIYYDKDGSLWVGTQNTGIYIVTTRGIKNISVSNGLSSNNISAISKDSDGNFWIGTGNAGINRIFNGEIVQIKSSLDYINNQIYSFFEDKDRTLWIGVAGSLFQLIDGIITTYTQADGLSYNLIRTILEDTKGTIWIGSIGGGLISYKNGKFSARTTKDNLIDNTIRCLSEDSKGNIWIGTQSSGVQVMKDEKFVTSFSTQNGLSSNNIRSVCEESDGTIWFATHGGYLTKYKNGVFETIDSAKGFPSKRNFVIIRAKDNSLWIGSQHKGLFQYKNKRFIQHGQFNTSIYTLYEDSDSVLWLGTSSRGLIQFKKGKFTFFDRQSGLFDNTVYCIEQDINNNLWMTCNRGIFSVNKNDLQDYADGRIKQIPCRSYGIVDGLKNVEFNGGNYPASCKTRDGQLIFPSVKGIVIINTDNAKTNSKAPDVIFENILIDGIETNTREVIHLKAGRKRIDFTFTAFNYANPQKIKFKCFLEGFDISWQILNHLRSYSYTNIPKGEYTFHIAACNSDGIWSNQDKTIKIIVHPAFWETWWFRFIAVIFIAFLLYNFYKIRVRIIKEQKRVLEQTVQERTNELSETNTLLEENQAELEIKQEELAAHAEMLAITNEELKKLNNTKDKFFSIIAHDLRNPFNLILGFSELLIDSIEKQKHEKSLQYAKELYQTSIRTYDLLENLLNWSRSQSQAIQYNPKSLNLKELIDYTILLLENSAKLKGINLSSDLSKDIFVHADKNMILTVLRNLVTNAIKFSRNGDNITIDITEFEEHVVVSVTDTGVGIKPTIIDKLFMVEENVKTEGTAQEPGTGLGLILCKEFIEKNGGEIWVQSKEGRGSCFSFTLQKRIE